MKISPLDYLVKNNLIVQSQQEAHFLEFSLLALEVHYLEEEHNKLVINPKSLVEMPNPQHHYLLQLRLLEVDYLAQTIRVSLVVKKLLTNLVDRFLGKQTICSQNLKIQSPTKSQNMVMDKKKKKIRITLQTTSHLPSSWIKP